MRTALILEDNVKSYEMLAGMLKKIDDTVHILYAPTLEEAYRYAMEYSIQLFLLDIILKHDGPTDLSGIRFADIIRKLPRYEFTPIIFITAMEDPHMYAYSDLHCYSFIEKPYDIEETEKILRQALRIPVQSDRKETIFFRVDNVLFKKKLDEIVYIENSRRCRMLYAVDGELKLPYKPCRDILLELGMDRFIQCSRFGIVNCEYVVNIDKSNLYLQLRGIEKRIGIGRAYLDQVIRKLI